MFIDFMAKIGWAYDLKTVNKDIIDSRKNRAGDGSVTNEWGFADVEKSEADIKFAKNIAKKGI